MAHQTMKKVVALLNLSPLIWSAVLQMEVYKLQSIFVGFMITFNDRDETVYLDSAQDGALYVL